MSKLLNFENHKSIKERRSQNQKEKKESGHQIIKKRLPEFGVEPIWNVKSRKVEINGKDFDDISLINLYDHLDGVYTQDKVLAAVKSVALQNRYNPLVDYISGLKWDGKSRIKTFATDYLGAPEKKFNILTFKFLISAIARAECKNTGIPKKVDTVLILEGKQGCGKSTACQILGGKYYHNLGAGSQLTDRDSLETLHSETWIAELGELTSVSKKEASELKDYFATARDTWQTRYDKLPHTCVRDFVFVGTINPGSQGYLKDETGSRRFWICPVGQIQLDKLKIDRDQIWAEALHYFEQDEQWWLTPEEEKIREEINSSRELETQYSSHLDLAMEMYGSRRHISTQDIYNILGIKTLNNHERTLVSKYMAKSGWSHGRRKINNSRISGYFKD